jgi:hypothetical protein
VGLVVLGAGVSCGGEGGCGRGPGFSSPYLLRAFSGGKCGAEKGGVNDFGKKPQGFLTFLLSGLTAGKPCVWGD